MNSNPSDPSPAPSAVFHAVNALVGFLDPRGQQQQQEGRLQAFVRQLLKDLQTACEGLDAGVLGSRLVDTVVAKLVETDDTGEQRAQQLFTSCSALQQALGLGNKFFDRVFCRLTTQGGKAPAAGPDCGNPSAEWNEAALVLLASISALETREQLPRCMQANPHIQWVQGGTPHPCGKVPDAEYEVRGVPAFPVNREWLTDEKNLEKLAAASGNPSEFREEVLSTLQRCGEGYLYEKDAFPAPEGTVLVPAPNGGATVTVMPNFGMYVRRRQDECRHNFRSEVQVSIPGFRVSTKNRCVPTPVEGGSPPRASPSPAAPKLLSGSSGPKKRPRESGAEAGGAEEDGDAGSLQHAPKLLRTVSYMEGRDPAPPFSSSYSALSPPPSHP